MPSKNSRPPDDEVTMRLRQAARKRPPLSIVGLLLTIFFCGGPLGLLIWLIVPRPAPPEIEVVAFDELATTASEIRLRAQILPKDDPQARLSGIDVVFTEGRLLEPGQQPRQLTAAANARGEASVAWDPASEKAPIEFLVRHIDQHRRRRSEDRARLFVWPADSDLVLVCIHTLADAGAKDWRDKNILDIGPADAAGATLQALASRRIVYLADAADDAWTYRRMRHWLEYQRGQGVLPKGPVLGRRLASALKGQFKGAMTAIVGEAAAARVYHDATIRTILLGAGEPPPGVVRYPSWQELAEDLDEIGGLPEN